MANRLLLILAAASMLGACSIWATQEEQDAYRQSHPDRHAAAAAPAPVAAAPAIVTTPPAEPVPPPTAVAANVAAPPSAPARAADNGEVVVPGVVHRQVAPPNGDPRSTMERMADIRSWDQCVMHSQNVQSDPLRPITDTPEDICRQRLGMNNRTSVPDSRKPHS